MIIWIILLLLFTTITIILISGHGGFLIAGYNTMSPKNKEAFNEIQLSRFVGLSIMLPTDLFLLILFFIKTDQQALLLAVIFIVYIFVVIFYLNKKKFGKKN